MTFLRSPSKYSNNNLFIDHNFAIYRMLFVLFNDLWASMAGVKVKRNEILPISWPNAFN